MLYIGSHVGYNKKDQLYGSVLETINYGANVFMFYTGAPQNTFRSNIDDNITMKAKKLMDENNIDYSKVIVHAPYIINLANNKDLDKYNFSINFLKEEINRCEKLGCKYLVLHPGSHVSLGIDQGIKNISNALNLVLDGNNNVTILLETMAGKGTEVGSNLEEIKRIIDLVDNKEYIGVCLDTCHLNDSGYDMSKFDDYLDYFDKIIGINYIKCIHINDSKNVIGSHKDRHENIGFGTIGFNNLINIIYNKRLEDIPKILETPYVNGFAPYKEEINMIKNKIFNERVFDNIKNKN